MKKMGIAVQEFLTPGRWRVILQIVTWSIQNQNFIQSSIMDGFDFANSAKTSEMQLQQSH